MEDAALVQLALANPERGFAAIYEQYGTSLYNYCFGILRSTADAGDALQDSFLTVISKIAQLRDPSKLRPWLYSIARNQCYRRHRSRSRERPIEIDETMLSESNQTGMPAPTDELVLLVWQATHGLAEADQSVLELNLRHELDGEELATALGVTGPKCSVMLHRAKERLRIAVGAFLVARAGTEECDELATIVTGHDFTPLVRKRVARHITSCSVCEETERRHRPETYLALVPLFDVPADLRDRVLVSMQSAVAGELTETPHMSWDSDGFPRPPSSNVRRPALFAGALVVAVIVALVVLVGANTGRSTSVVAGPALPSSTPTTATAAAPNQGPPDSTIAPPPTAPPTPSATALPEAPAVPPVAEAPTPTATALPEAPVAPPVAEVATPTPTPTAMPLPTATPTPLPEAPPVAPALEAPTLTPTPTFPTFQGTTLEDMIPPTVTLFTLDCLVDPVVVFVVVSDNWDPSPTVSLTVTWEETLEGEPDPGIPMIAFGAGYRAFVPASERTDPQLDIFVRGSAADDRGNTSTVAETRSCQFFD